VSVGTFGCLVRKRGNDEDLFILSNSHVLANSGVCRKGDVIVQPGGYDGGSAPKDVIATLAEWVPFHDDTAMRNLVDAAIAKVKDPSSVGAAIKEIGMPTGVSIVVRRGMRVQKTGRTTGYTQGLITDVDYRMRLNYGPGVGYVGLRDLVLCTRYTSGGDSGSAVLSMSKRLVGLHFAGSPSTSIFCRIRHVIDLLDIQPVLS
jgi:hypothetical protein